MEQPDSDLGDKRVPYIFHTSVHPEMGLRVRRGGEFIDILIDQESDEGITGVVVSEGNKEHKVRTGHANEISMNPYSRFRLEVHPSEFSDGVFVALNPVPIDIYSFDRKYPDGTTKEINLQRFLNRTQ